MRVLENWSWPGNVRELKNVIESAIVFADGNFVQVEDLPQFLLGKSTKVQEVVNSSLPFAEAKRNWISTFEKMYLKDILAKTKGNISQAAIEAGIDRKTIHRLVSKNGIKVDR